MPVYQEKLSKSWRAIDKSVLRHHSLLEANGTIVSPRLLLIDISRLRWFLHSDTKAAVLGLCTNKSAQRLCAMVYRWLPPQLLAFALHWSNLEVGCQWMPLEEVIWGWPSLCTFARTTFGKVSIGCNETHGWQLVFSHLWDRVLLKFVCNVAEPCWHQNCEEHKLHPSRSCFDVFYVWCVWRHVSLGRHFKPPSISLLADPQTLRTITI